MVYTGLFIAARRRRLKKALANGAVVIDIREPQQFQNGHIDGAVNIPVQKIEESIDRLKTYEATLIICNGFAFSCFKTVWTLRSQGLNVYNGGNWKVLNRIKQSL